MGPCSSSRVLIDSNGFLWVFVDLYDSQWIFMVPNRSFMVRNSYFGPYFTLCILKSPYEYLCILKRPYGFF